MTDARILLHPAFPLLLGAIVTAALPPRKRIYFSPVFTFLSLICLFAVSAGSLMTLPFLNGMELLFFQSTTLSRLMCFFTLVVVFCSQVYSLGREKGREGCWSLVYAAAACGVLMAGDFFTLVLWWEAMSVGAVFLIWSRRDPKASKAGFRYLMIHFLSGNLLLMGAVLYASQGITQLGPLEPGGAAYWLVLAGVGISAGMIPFHSWIPDAYPEATIGGSAILSGVTTKVAAITLLRLFSGESFLLGMGIVMAFWGVLYALRENNIRRLLSYHIISQLGLIIAAIGIGTPMAKDAAVALTIGNILYKGLLYMSAGSVLYATGRQKLTEVGNLFKAMPITSVFFFIGSLAIAGVPGLMGFAVKPLVVSSAVYSYQPVAELLLYAAGIGTFLSIPLKLGGHMLWGTHPAPPILRKPKTAMYVGMTLLTVFILAIGFVPGLLYSQLPWQEEVHFSLYTADHILSEVEFLLAAWLAYRLMNPLLHPKDFISLDLDWFYRVPLPRFFLALSRFANFVRLSVWKGILVLVRALSRFVRNPVSYFMKPIDGGDSTEEYCADKYRLPVGDGALLILMVFAVVYFYVTIF